MKPLPNRGREDYHKFFLLTYIFSTENIILSNIYLCIYIITREIPAFGVISLALRESGAPGAHLPPPLAAVKEKVIKIWGACGAHSFNNFRRVMRIPNMCLVLKLDNRKVVSIANEQTESQTDRIMPTSSTVL